MRTAVIAVSAAVALLTAAGCSSGPDAEELCQQMADNAGQQADNVDVVTEEDYLTLRGQFEQVNDEELSTNGVKLVDAVWQVSQLDNDAGALMFMGQLSEAMSGVAGACAKHGVTLDFTPPPGQELN